MATKTTMRVDGCWVWTGARNGEYGKIQVDGREELAHRAAYIVRFGSIPPRARVRHLCGVKVCVNPDHLRSAPA